ncbi:MAG TPA: LysE family translocator [Streptosporangiaceae bacterium]|nr:LysE family translocator [Streptosporangiaceae bacterium]
MISAGHLAGYAVASFIIIVIPGPSVLFVVGRALAHGRRTALATVVGNAAGNYLVAVCVAFGIGTLVQRSAVVFTVIKLAGAAYLIWLGVQAIRHRKSLSAAFSTAAAPRGTFRAVREGFTVGVTNPKAFILFGAVLPQFVNRAAGHVPEQMLLLALISITIGLASDSTWGVTASAVRTWFARSPRRLELVGGAGGLAMISVGLTVAVTGRQN